MIRQDYGFKSSLKYIVITTVSPNQNKKNRETNAGILQVLITMMTSIGYLQNIADEIKSNK